MRYNNAAWGASISYPQRSADMSSLPPFDSASPLFFEAPPSRILLAESDLEIADIICSLLEEVGFEVAVATDGQYALLLAADFAADLVILDTALEGASSSEVTHTLKVSPQLSGHYRHVPILYLAYSEQLINQRFHQHPDTPITDYIFKPIDATSLIERVRRCLLESKP